VLYNKPRVRVLKTFHGELIPPGGYDVEILCDVTDAELLLDRAKHFHPEAMPYIQRALDSVRHLPS
jgi:hypothetical protein